MPVNVRIGSTLRWIASALVLLAAMLLAAMLLLGREDPQPEDGGSPPVASQQTTAEPPSPAANALERNSIPVADGTGAPPAPAHPDASPAVARRLLGRVETSTGEIVARPQPVVVVFRSGTVDAERHEIIAAGTFELPVPPAAEVALLTSLGNARGSTRLSPHGDTEVVLRLGKLVYCLGQVVDAGDRAPIATASVVGCPGLGDLPVRVTAVDANGRFELWLPQNTLLTATAPGFAAAPGVFLTTRHHGDPLLLACRRTTEALIVRVRDGSSAPIAGARIYAGRRWSAVQYDHNHLENRWSLSLVDGTSDAEGVCRLNGDWSSYNSIQVVCRQPGMATRLLTVPRSHIVTADAPPKPEQLVEIVMTPGNRLDGVVRDRSGEPVADIRVWMNYGTFAETHARTNDRGEFTIEACAPDANVELLVDSAKWERQVVVVDASGRGPISIVLTPRR